jgi:uncharacterized membrane protein YphA (DoxX/SURF4 family)
MNRRALSPSGRILPWALAAWIFYVFVWYLQYKFTGHDGSVMLFTILTDWLGFHGYEKVMRIGTGSAELVAAILCFVPRLRAVGAAMTTGIMSGAIFFHVVSPLGIDPYHDGGKLFKEACATWLAGTLLLWLSRDQAFAIARGLPIVGSIVDRVCPAAR